MAFVMNGKTFKTMMDIARELNRARVKRTDFAKFGIVEVDSSEIAEAPENVSKPAEEVVEAPKGEVKGAEEQEVVEAPENAEAEVEEKEEAPTETETEDAGLNKDAEAETEQPAENGDENVEPNEAEPEKKAPKQPKQPKMTDEEKLAKRKAKREARKLAKAEAKKPTPEMLAKAEELQVKSGYTDIWDWAVDMKKKSAEEVFALAESLEITWNRHDTQRIDRMHAVQAIRENLFPGQKRPKVRRSAWKGVPNEFIIETAKKNGIDILEIDNEKVLRMHLLKALKGIGIATPEDAGYKEQEASPTN